MNIVILLLDGHANKKAESFVIISFLFFNFVFVSILSVFITQTCTDFSPTFSEL